MIKLTKELLKEIAQDVMLNITDEQAEEIYNSEQKAINDFAQLNKIDVSNIEPMFYPNDYQNSFLRKDDNPKTITKEAVLNNAPLHNDKYILIKKVVK